MYLNHMRIWRVIPFSPRSGHTQESRAQICGHSDDTKRYGHIGANQIHEEQNLHLNEESPLLFENPWKETQEKQTFGQTQEAQASLQHPGGQSRRSTSLDITCNLQRAPCKQNSEHHAKKKLETRRYLGNKGTFQATTGEIAQPGKRSSTGDRPDTNKTR